MARILLFLVLGFLVWLVVRLSRGNGNRSAGGGDRAGPSKQAALEAIEQCAWCGVHAPAGTAVALPDGRIYCSDAHREQARLAASPPARSADS